jgi:poly(3-hydroxybutyrate) depolymerase
VPSPGCARANATPPTTAETAGLEVSRRFPAGYDGVTPMPLVLAFHATNYPAQGLVKTLTNGQPAAERYVVVAPRANLGGTGSFESYQPRQLAPVLQETLAELCVDQNRVFGAGSGSGGRFLINLVDYASGGSTTLGVRFRAAGIVGTYSGGNRQRSVPTIFIHPFDSPNSAGVAQDRDGTKALAIFRMRNACGESSTPADVAGCMSGSTQVNPGCVDFDACAAPLRWCHHDDPFSSTTGDPWPCFASAAILEFFDRLGG